MDATTPTRGRAEGAGLASRRKNQTVKAPQSIRRPCSRTVRKSPGHRRCCSGRKRMGPRLAELAALEPAGTDNLAATTGGHAGTITNLAGTDNLAATTGGHAGT